MRLPLTTFDYVVKIIPFSLRLPEDLREAVEKIAAKEHRTLAQVILIRLRESIGLEVLDAGSAQEEIDGRREKAGRTPKLAVGTVGAGNRAGDGIKGAEVQTTRVGSNDWANSAEDEIRETIYERDEYSQ